LQTVDSTLQTGDFLPNNVLPFMLPKANSKQAKLSTIQVKLSTI